MLPGVRGVREGALRTITLADYLATITTPGGAIRIPEAHWFYWQQAEPEWTWNWFCLGLN